MKSKSFNLSRNPTEKDKLNKTFDFVNFYKSAGETNVKLLEKRKSDSGSGIKENVSNKTFTPKRERSPNKNKRKFKDSMDISKINIDGNSLPHGIDGSSLNDSKVTSTPNITKKDKGAEVKSIIKNKSLLNETLNVSDNNISIKPKKRNKSVSFMLDDNEDIAIKKSKSEETVSYIEKLDPNSLIKKYKHKKYKKKSQDEKENKVGVNNMGINIVTSENIETPSRSMQIEDNSENLEATVADMNQKTEKRKHKKHNKIKHAEVEQEICSTNIEHGEESKIKRIKKKKRHIKSHDIDNVEAQDEPALKSSKKDLQPDKIVQELENLNIGDNAHTLTNLLDEMAVIDKNKKKIKKKSKEMDKRKIHKQENTNNTTPDNEGDSVKVKVKWDKRKWNKDKKGGVNADKYLTSIIVENLPFKIMCTYKKLLAEYFEKYGMIKQVGIAEMHPTENPKPVFSTTVNFYSEDAAEKALEEDNTMFEGARIRVKRPLPAVETTLVVRSFGELSEQAVSSVFNAAGRIRNIRLLVKGRRSNSTSFIEFDGPESVERAIKMAEDARIGGKKIIVAKFEIRAKNQVKNSKTGCVKDNANYVKNNKADQEDNDDSNS